LEHRLDQACCTIRELEGQLQYQHEGAQHIGSCIQRMAEVYSHCKVSFDQALTRLANYEQRLVLVSRRVNSVNGKGATGGLSYSAGLVIHSLQKCKGGIV